MIYRIAGGHMTLVFITICILLGSAGIMTEQIQFLAANHHLNFIPTEVSLEENIAILIAAFGVFLEHRCYLLRRIYPDGIPDTVEQFDQYSHNIGVMFILVAIVIVAIDLLFLALDTWGINLSVLKYVEISILFSINLIAALMLVVFGFKACQQR